MKTVFHFVALLMIALLCVAGCGEDEAPEITNSQPVIDRVIVPEEVQSRCPGQIRSILPMTRTATR